MEGVISLQLDRKHAMMQMDTVTMPAHTSGSYDDSWYKQMVNAVDKVDWSSMHGT